MASAVFHPILGIDRLYRAVVVVRQLGDFDVAFMCGSM